MTRPTGISPEEAAGATIGRYRRLGLLGSGGMTCQLRYGPPRVHDDEPRHLP